MPKYKVTLKKEAIVRDPRSPEEVHKRVEYDEWGLLWECHDVVVERLPEPVTITLDQLEGEAIGDWLHGTPIRMRRLTPEAKAAFNKLFGAFGIAHLEGP